MSEPLCSFAIRCQLRPMLDTTIVVVYFLIVFAIGFYHSRRERTSSDYFLAGQNVGWFAVGASLFATNISSEHFIGLAGSGASTGLAVGCYEWSASFCLFLLGWRLAMRQYNVLTSAPTTALYR